MQYSDKRNTQKGTSSSPLGEDALNLRDTRQLTQFIETLLTEQARISHTQHGTPDYAGIVPDLARRFAGILQRASLPTTNQAEYSSLFIQLNTAGGNFFSEKQERANFFMLNVWVGVVLGKVDNHRSLK